MQGPISRRKRRSPGLPCRTIGSFFVLDDAGAGLGLDIAASLAFKYRRSFRLFGCNAPPSFMQPSTSATVPGGIAWALQSRPTSRLAGRHRLYARCPLLGPCHRHRTPVRDPPAAPVSGPEHRRRPLLRRDRVRSRRHRQVLARLRLHRRSPSRFRPSAANISARCSARICCNTRRRVRRFVFPPPPPPPGPQTFLATITQVAEVPASSPVQGQSGGQGAITDSVTQITVRPASVSTLGPINDIRSVSIFELVGAPIELSGRGVTLRRSAAPPFGCLDGWSSLGQSMGIEVGRTIQQNAFVPGVVIEPADIGVGREVILADATGSAVEASVQATPAIEPSGGADGAFAHLVLSLQATACLARRHLSAVLLGNVAQGGNGRTISGEVLGTGAAATPLQSFKLQNHPLTYVPSTAPGGVSSSLTAVGGAGGMVRAAPSCTARRRAHRSSPRAPTSTGAPWCGSGGPQYGALLRDRRHGHRDVSRHRHRRSEPGIAAGRTDQSDRPVARA